jgi:hypothetical protein
MTKKKSLKKNITRKKTKKTSKKQKPSISEKKISQFPLDKITKMDLQYRNIPIPYQTVNVSSTSLFRFSPVFKLYWVNTIQSNTPTKVIRMHIYRIIYNDYNTYFYVSEKIDYLLIQIATGYYLCKINPSAKTLTTDTINSISKYMIEKINFNVPGFHKELEKINMRIIVPYFNKTDPYDISKAQSKLVDINNILKHKCSNLSIHLDYVYNLDLPNDTISTYSDIPNLSDPILCLYNEYGCISSISYYINAKDIEIISKTEPEYEKKKYNKFLRCVSIILSKFILNTVENVFSYSVNPISTYILVSYFGGIIREDADTNKNFFKWLKANKLELNPHNYKQIFEEYYKHCVAIEKDLTNFEKTHYVNNITYIDDYIYTIEVEVPINEETIQNATMKLDEIINELICN